MLFFLRKCDFEKRPVSKTTEFFFQDRTDASKNDPVSLGQIFSYEHPNWPKVIFCTFVFKNARFFLLLHVFCKVCKAKGNTVLNKKNQIQTRLTKNDLKNSEYTVCSNTGKL
jgi:hypothetical protein